MDCAAAPYTPPVHQYSHSTGCESVTGGAFVPDGAWPDTYDGSYLLGDYVCNKIFELTPKSGGGFVRTEFATGLGKGGPIAMAFDPYGSNKALYYTTYANGGEVHRIVYAAGANLAPTASVETTSPNYGPTPLTVDFDGSGSRDPDGDTPLTYFWDFGDGTATSESTTPTTSHTYDTAGTYTAELKVRDACGAVSAPATVRIFPGNTPPEPTIESPTSDKLFKVGEEIMLQGSATDPEDGQLPEGALSWEVVLHHDTHTHPHFSGTGNDLTFAAPAPEDLAATENSYLEIKLTATDSQGLSKTIAQELHPKQANVTFDSRPTGLRLQVNGTTFTAPQTFVPWEGYKLSVNAPYPQTLARTTYVFSSWSDGGAQSHGIVSGAELSTYTAIYTAWAATAL